MRVILWLAAVATVVSQDYTANFLFKNVLPSGLPLSYRIDPANYFDTVPTELRPHDYNETKKAMQCAGTMQPAENWNNYEFQTERLLSALGLNIYDGACWTIALSITGYSAIAFPLYNETLRTGVSGQLADIHGDKACAGVTTWGECEDPNEIGACGLCYGDATGNEAKTLPKENAFFFRMISSYYAIENTTNALCPDRKQLWTWNDWRPVLGENTWANLLGALHLVMWRYGRTPTDVPDDAPELTLAANFIPALKKMLIPSIGGVYYAPRNTWDRINTNIGSTVSTENNGSLLAGLKALKWFLEQKTGTKWATLLPDVNMLIQNVTAFLKFSYDKENGYFRQGGEFDPRTGKFTWGQGDGVPLFATDCQTWVASALGSATIDGWFGAETTYKLWETTKALAGYAPQADGTVKGVGYTNNTVDQVFSGEWTLGAVNWLRILAAENNYSSSIIIKINADADKMRRSVRQELKKTITMDDGTTAFAYMYANKRYWIPFGWWANPLPAVASTSWMMMLDNYYNPLMLNGRYASIYAESAFTAPKGYPFPEPAGGRGFKTPPTTVVP